MKHRRPSDRVSLTGLAELAGLQLPEDHADQLLTFLYWLEEVSRTLNLTAIARGDEGVRLHILDSITAAPEVAQAPPGELLDLGSGGGLPGIPLAVVTGRQTVLLESVRKKSAAVATFLQTEQDLRVTAIAERSEDHARSNPSHYACVVARAVAELPVLVELATPLLMHGGRLVCMKARPTRDEIARGDEAATRCGMVRSSVREFELPGGSERRQIIVFVKTGEPSLELPRRAGRAQSHPLA